MQIFFFLFFTFAQSVYGQQNFFNMPSGMLTPKGKTFYQQQVNFYHRENLSSKHHLVRGVGSGMEAGVNFLNWSPVRKGSKPQQGADPEANILSATFQKVFRLSKSRSLNLGTQTGISQLGQGRATYLTGKHYLLMSTSSKVNHYRLTAGPWVSDRRFNGRGDTVGVMAGAEWMFTDGYYLMGDWISGDTKNSVSVVGGMVDLAPGVQICLGYLIPNSGSSEQHGAVFELNVFNF